MSYGNSLHKDRLYFTQCNDTILLKCPECTSTKILRQCKIHPNFPSLWKHTKQDHKDIMEIRRDEIIQVLNNVFKAFSWNMLPKWEYSEFVPKAATSSSILIDGKPPRIDVLENLEKIAKILKTQSTHYPKFQPRLLSIFVEKAIGKKDYRVHKKYVDCVTRYSEPDKIHGVYDVTQFCEELDA